MSFFNKAILIGRLARDPEIRYTKDGVAVTNFTLAVNRAFKNKEGEREADFLDVVAWRQLAELCANYLQKGSMAAVEGDIRVESYEDQSGSRRKAWKINANTVRFLDGRGDGQKTGGGTGDTGYEENEGDVSEEDIPF